MGKVEYSLIWFRQDLRILTNKALVEAVKQGPVIGLYLIDPKQIIGAQRWWLHHSLQSLANDLKKYNIELLIRQDSLLNVLAEFNIKKVFWNRCYDPFSVKRDTDLKKILRSKNIEVKSFNSSLLVEPSRFKNKQGGIYRVFTPFWKQIRQTVLPEVEARPQFNVQENIPAEFNIDAYNLLPKHPNWASEFPFKSGEMEAHRLLDMFLKDKIVRYVHDRNYPSLVGTSSLSPYLHFGEIGSHQIYAKVYELGCEQFLAELGWREFAHYLLYHFPTLLNEPLNQKFKSFEYRDDRGDFDLWKQGLTGYPFVDAGMRQLWKTGWMHNRVRMVVASFLTKHLLLPWKWGANWFLETLLDADLASNTIGWQWVAGCGPDAAPYYRIFNPVVQSEKFDPKGDYIKMYIPELKDVPLKYIHKPWLYPYKIDYPKPMVDHDFARHRALERYKEL